MQHIKSWEIDSKAMRKVTSDEAVVVMIENASASFGINVMVQLRFLIKAG